MTSPRRTHASILLVAAATAALLAAPAVSSAAKRHRHRLGPVVSSKAFRQISGPPGTVGTVTARCPRGTKVISGGQKTFSNIQLEGDAHVMVPYVSRRNGPRAWTVSVYLAGDGFVNPKLFGAIAYCRKGMGRLVPKVRRGSVVVGTGGSPFPLRSTYAACPNNTWPVSGGYAIRLSAADLAAMSTDGAPPGIVFGSRIVAGGWEVTTGRFLEGRSVVRSYAYCAKWRVKVRARAVYLSGAGQLTHTATPLCPRRTKAVAAGFYAPFIFRSESDVSAVIPLEARRLNPRRWLLGAVPLVPYPSRLIASTYCA